MTGTTTASVEKDAYLAAFARFEKEIGTAGRSWVGPLRDEGIACFAEAGFPTTGDEEWRKTSVAPITRTAFSLPSGEAARRAARGLTTASLAGLTFEPRGCRQIVFVNGRHEPALSSPGVAPAGLRMGSLQDALESARGLVEPHLARHARCQGSPFTALNTAFLRDGAFLHLPEGAALEEAVHLLFVTVPPADGGAPLMTHPRNLIVIGKGARVRLVETYVGPPEGSPKSPYFTNVVTEIVVGEGAVVAHHKLQREDEAAFHIATLHASQGRASSFTSHSIALGGALVRNDLDVVLGAEGAECALNGLYMVSGRQHVDNHTVIDHAEPHCSSRELYKGVLEGRSRAVFNGKIIVRPDARKTDAKQANRNLILSEEALVDTKPELQIFNNDVKCTHAAAIGQLDEAALFYLRSRGVGRDAARSLLIHAFVSDLVNRIEVDPLREEMEAMLLARLPEYVGVKEAAL